MGILVFTSMSYTCLNTHSGNLVKVANYDLTMPEPSGLALDPDGKHLWLVSDRKGWIYKVDLRGNMQQKIDIKAQDYEGVAIHANGDTLYVLDEAKNRISAYNLFGEKAYNINLKTKVSNKSGPEGLDIDWSNGHFYIVNEKNPRLLLELNADGIEVSRRRIQIRMNCG